MSRRQTLSAYTPSNTDPHILRRIFVQRETLFEQITNRFCQSVETGDMNHVLLVGPRGSGKTHFVSLVEWELRKRQDLANPMCICWLGEDDSFTGLIYLASGIAQQLHSAYPNDFPSDFKKAARGLSKNEGARVILNNIVRQLNGRTLILITENLHMTFPSLGSPGRAEWRAFLQETRCISTLATSQQLFDNVSKRDETFFGFFDIHHLEALSVDDAHDLISRIATEQNKQELVNYLGTPEGRYRVRALHYLAGGNHRMYVLLSEFLNRDSLDSLVQAFEDLAEDMTSYFQERMRTLPDQQRQIAQSLCYAEGAMTVKAIAEDTFIDERTCSKQLGELRKSGYVQSQKRGKESYYDMAEPLMRLCLEAKNQRGEPLRMVVRFLKAWFPLDELSDRAKQDAADARVTQYRDLAVQATNAFDAAIAETLSSEITNRIQSGNFGEASELTRELMFADSVSAIQLRGFGHREQGHTDLAIADFTAVIEMHDASAEQRAIALVNRGYTHGEQGQTDLEIVDYSTVIEMHDAPTEQRAIALVNRGSAHGEQGQTDLEIADYTNIIEMTDAPADFRAIAQLNRGAAHEKQGQTELAIADLTAVIEMHDASAEQRAIAQFNRGAAHENQGQTSLGIVDYTAVIKMHGAPAEFRAIAQLNRGAAHKKQNQTDLCIADWTDVIEMYDTPGEQRAIALLNRGHVQREQGQSDLAIDDFTGVIEMYDASAEQRAIALGSRGFVYGQQAQTDLAIDDFTAVIESNGAPAEERAIAQRFRGFTYTQQNRTDLAITDYTAVIEMQAAPIEQRLRALGTRGDCFWQAQNYELAAKDFELILTMHGDADPNSLKVAALFSLIEPQIAIEPLEVVLETLERAMTERARHDEPFAGTPRNILFMVLRRPVADWEPYCSGIAQSYIANDLADQLGQGLTAAIETLDRGDFTKSQLDAWKAIWHDIGDDCDSLQIPLRCLDAAVVVMHKAPPSDLPLLKLPPEIRKLVRPLLNATLGEE